MDTKPVIPSKKNVLLLVRLALRLSFESFSQRGASVKDIKAGLLNLAICKQLYKII